MFDWNKAVDGHYAMKNQQNLFEMLEKLIDGVLKEQRLNERSDMVPGSEAVFDDPSFSIPLPTMKISEAWGKRGTKDRDIIENYTRNIPGSTFEQKISNLNKILTEGAAGENLSQIVSTMMICEILYSILSDFTESAGGFIFEGFLAGLFGQESVQITKPEDIEGMAASGKPITDVVLGGKHYSLKLLGPGTGVKGSFQNMVEHFASGIDHVVYLDARRVQNNQGLEFIEFDVTLDNFIDVFVTPVLKTKTVDNTYEKPDDFKAALTSFAKEKKAIKEIAFASPPSELGLNAKKYTYSAAKGQKQKLDEAVVSGDDMDKVIQTILAADNETLQKYGPFAVSYAEMKFEGTKAEQLFDSYGNVEKFQRLMGSGDKKGALEHLKTLPGYKGKRQFEFTPKQAASIAGARSVGTLMVGEQYMKKAWANYADLLKRTIGPIYQELRQFSDDLDSYVLGKTGEENVEDRKQYAINAIDGSLRLGIATENAIKELEK